jgi:prepilin-type N-terminal cleavage/methylation domain-containing protein
MHEKSKNNLGFTIIELIIVLSILGVIALIGIPRYINVQERAKVDADYRSAGTIAKAAELYYAEKNVHEDFSSNTILYSSLENDDRIEDDLKLQSEKFDSIILNDTTVVISIVPSSGSIVTIKVKNEDGAMIKMYPDDRP